MRRVVLGAIVVMLAGCSGGSSPESAFDQEIQAVFLGDIDMLRMVTGDTWIDFGSCIEYDREDALENIGEWFDSEQHAQDMAAFNNYRELIDWTTLERFDVGSDEFFDCEHYTYQPGDIGMWAGGSEESPLFDGWGGVYRSVGGRWVNIGGD